MGWILDSIWPHRKHSSNGNLGNGRYHLGLRLRKCIKMFLHHMTFLTFCFILVKYQVISGRVEMLTLRVIQMYLACLANGRDRPICMTAEETSGKEWGRKDSGTITSMQWRFCAFNSSVCGGWFSPLPTSSSLNRESYSSIQFTSVPMLSTQRQHQIPQAKGSRLPSFSSTWDVSCKYRLSNIICASDLPTVDWGFQKSPP